MQDVMIDIETLGREAGCVVLSIGATEFYKNGVGDGVNILIDVEESVTACGLKLEPATVLWWFTQSKEAQNAVINAQGREPLDDCLIRFNDFLHPGNKRVWCNGAAFDFPILKGLYKASGREPAWMYYNEMDFRTIKGLVGKDAMKQHQCKPTIAHDGLADAIAQAQTLINLHNAGLVKVWS